MLINGKNEVFMVDRDNSVFHIANLEFPFRKDPRIHLSNTLLDGVSLFPVQTFLLMRKLPVISQVVQFLPSWCCFGLFLPEPSALP